MTTNFLNKYIFIKNYFFFCNKNNKNICLFYTNIIKLLQVKIKKILQALKLKNINKFRRASYMYRVCSF